MKPRIGVSRCLLGDRVRYDGRGSLSLTVIEKLGECFELIPICPEVEAGLTIPRPPVQLSDSLEQPRLRGRDDPNIDVTDIMRDYCERKPAELDDLSGYVFKSRSPSCGLVSTPVFIDGVCVSEHSRGVFARALCTRYPDLPVIEDTELEHGLLAFITKVKSQAGNSQL